MISLDTNAILRVMLRDNKAQALAVSRLLNKARGQVAIADIALIEATYVLTKYYKLSRVEASDSINSLIALPVINCNREMINRALGLYVEHPALSFEDCCLAAYAELNEALPLYTFDKKLASQTHQAELIS